MLRIDLDQVEKLNNTIRQQMSKLQDVRNHLQMTSAQVDPQIRSRRNIESRLRRINHELQDLEYQLRNLHTFIQHSVGRYRDAEKSIANQASQYGDEYRPRHYVQTSANQNQFDRIGAFEVKVHKLTPQDFIHARKVILDYFKNINASKAIYDAFNNLMERSQNNVRIMKELNWSYVGMDVDDAIEKLMGAGSIRSIAAKDALERLWQEREALKDSQNNASLDLTDEQLLILAEIDPYGVEDYIRRKERELKNKEDPIRKSFESIKGLLSDYWDGHVARHKKAQEAGFDFDDFNYWTLGLGGALAGIFTEAPERTAKMLDSTPDFFNWLTLGATGEVSDTITEIMNPAEPYSKEHWLASFELAIVIATLGRARLRSSTPEFPKEKNIGIGEGTGQTANVVSSKTVISPEMEAKILEGQRKALKNELIGGHSPNIRNANESFAVEILSTNADGTKNVVFIKQFPDGNISKLKKSTLFPDSWTDEQILKSITDVGNTPAISTRLRDGATWHRATIYGVEIDVIKVGDDVTSGYPTGTVNASRPSGF